MSANAIGGMGALFAHFSFFQNQTPCRAMLTEIAALLLSCPQYRNLSVFLPIVSVWLLILYTFHPRCAGA